MKIVGVTRTLRMSWSEWEAEYVATALRVLARNLRDAAGCALAWNYGATFDLTPDDDPGCWANYRRKPAPGWER